MKMLLTMTMLLITFQVFAQRQVALDDLGAIKLNLDDSNSNVYVIDQPNVHLKGGSNTSSFAYDCLRLDIQYLDTLITVQKKIKFAHQIRVLEAKTGGGLPAAIRNVLPATIKGDNVLFYLDKNFNYSTSIQVMAVNGLDLNEVIRENLPLVKIKDGSKVGPTTGLVYLRGCRF